jgi:hypothetical protein
MQGTLPPELSQMNYLETLNLQYNEFSGSLPPEWGGVGAFSSLENLMLNNNNLTGTIPQSYGNQGAFTSLSLLRLDGMSGIVGPFPDPFHLPSMLVLRLFNNSLSGSLNPMWGTEESLPITRVLSLQGQHIVGSLPKEWARPDRFNYIEEIFVDRNHINGGLPEEWGRGPSAMPNLRILDSSSNPIGGTFPPVWLNTSGSFPRLSSLNLANASLSGTLPEMNPAALPRLDRLQLQDNNLQGTIPESWKYLVNVRHLFIKPGNDDLCLGRLPEGGRFPFELCDASGGSSCLLRAVFNETNCPTNWQGVPLPPSPPPPGAPSTTTRNGISTGAIIGIAVGAAAGVALALGLGVFLYQKHAPSPSPFIPAEDKRQRDIESQKPGGGSSSIGRRSSNSMFGWFKRGGGLGGVITGRTMSSRVVATSIESPTDGTPPETTVVLRGSEGSAHNTLRGAGGSITSSPSDAATGVGKRTSDESLFLSGANGSPRGAAATAAADALRQSETMASTVSQWLSSGMIPSLDVEDWRIDPGEIEFAKRPDGTNWILGTGGQGVVYKAYRHGVQPVAAKVLPNTGEQSSPEHFSAKEDFHKEIALLKSCKDPNIVSFLGAVISADQTMLITEYMEGGNLARNLAVGKVGWYKRGKGIAIEVARGLVYLHSRRIVHMDIKSANILLSREGHAKIADVGMAKVIAKEFSAVSGNYGTLAWSAPEMLLGTRCTDKADIYGFGVVLWEICSQQQPMRGQLRDIKVPEECPAELRSLILQCLDVKPKKRPSALQLVEKLKAISDTPPAPPSSSQ